jgi:hypothetical protein
METPDFAIQPCQSKFTFWKVKASKNFREFIRVFQTSLNPNKIGPNSKLVFLLGMLTQILFRIWTCFQKESCFLSPILSD